MKTHIIRDTKVGISGISAVFAKKMTTWSLDYAREDLKERNVIAFKAIRDQQKLVDKMVSKGLITPDAEGKISEEAIKKASETLEKVLANLASTYDIEL